MRMRNSLSESSGGSRYGDIICRCQGIQTSGSDTRRGPDSSSGAGSATRTSDRLVTFSS